MIYKVGMQLGGPLTAIHYSLLYASSHNISLLTAEYQPSPLPPHIPPHHRALCIPGLSIQPTILANIITPWDYEFCIRPFSSPAPPLLRRFTQPFTEWRLWQLCVYGTVEDVFSNGAFEIVASNELIWKTLLEQ